MNIVGMDGSGRTGGNTGALVGALLRGAEEAGAATTFFELGRMNVGGCIACMGCKDGHRCVVQDDMQPFYDAAPEADVLFLASPVYLDHVTAQMMAFIQRTYCYIGRGLENHYPNPDAKVVVGITYGAGDPKMYDYVLDWMEGRMQFYFKLPTVAKLKVPAAAHDRTAGDDHPEVRRALELGRELASG
jgi:multimeric flavodoxin WrbA